MEGPSENTDPSNPSEGHRRQALECHSAATAALDPLYEAAAACALGAMEILRAEAERLVKRGAEWHDIKHLKR